MSDDAMRWLIDMYTHYMMIAFDISHRYTVMDIGRSYGSLWLDLGRGRIVGCYGLPAEAVMAGV